METKKANTEAVAPTEVIAYKGFDKNLKCRDYQYEVGKSYEQTGRIKACLNGFHACENPLDVLDYYPLELDTRFAIVKASGKISKDGNKLASAKISIEAELKFPEFVAKAIDYVKQICNQEKAPAASGYSSQLAASGYYSKLAASGDSSQLAASGDYSKLAASGYYSKLAASGDSSQLAASGDYSKLATSGYYSKLAASGDYSKLAASGYYSKLAASGYSSQLAASGDYSKLATSGYYSKLAASGDSSQLAASGDYSKLAASGYSSQLAASGYSSQLAASGKNSIAIAASENCTAKAGVGGCIALRWTKDEKPRLSVAYIGENGIKPDVYYKLDDAGEFVEVE
jgi:hypothetical protein